MLVDFIDDSIDLVFGHTELYATECNLHWVRGAARRESAQEADDREAENSPQQSPLPARKKCSHGDLGLDNHCLQTGPTTIPVFPDDVHAAPRLIPNAFSLSADSWLVNEEAGALQEARGPEPPRYCIGNVRSLRRR